MYGNMEVKMQQLCSSCWHIQWGLGKVCILGFVIHLMHGLLTYLTGRKHIFPRVTVYLEGSTSQWLSDLLLVLY